LKYVGKDLYKSFFKGYTQKQWGCEPRNLPASILKRLPLRFNYDDNYFNHSYQGMPENGYTEIVHNLLDHKNINISLDHIAIKNELKSYDHIFYSGPIDQWFDFRFGLLGYRTLNFEEEVHDGDYQGCAVMNYPDKNIPYTRISEHKYFSPWEKHDKTIIYKEYSKDFKIGDIPYYPIRLVKEKVILKQYVELASEEKNISFIGRLGTYRYLDMDVTIREAIDVAKLFLRLNKENKKIPVFFNNPL
jgi:UDP-galactopyranose mutase